MPNMWTKICTTLAGLLLLGTLTSGCDSLSNAIDCNGICTRYKDCYDSNYDVDACENRCRDNAGKDSDYMSKADHCNECIGDRSCVAATFNCAAECVGIVP